MTIKLHSLDRWKTLERGEAIMFEKMSNDGERRVRLHLNLAGRTTFYVEGPKGPRFLCVAGPGLETVEFAVSGKVAVMADEAAGEVQYQTAEGEPTFATVVDPVIFTKIANRRHRNPELEEVMYRMQLNMERRLAQQATEIEAAFERRRKEEENGRPAEIVVSDAPGAPAGAGGAEIQPSEPGAEKPGENATGADGGDQSSGGD